MRLGEDVSLRAGSAATDGERRRLRPGMRELLPHVLAALVLVALVAMVLRSDAVSRAPAVPPDTAFTIRMLHEDVPSPQDAQEALRFFDKGRASVVEPGQPLGRRNRPSWAIVEIQYRGKQAIDRILYLRHFQFDDVRYFVVDPSAEAREVVWPPPTAEVPAIGGGEMFHAVPVRLEPGRPTRVLIRLDTASVHGFPIRLVEEGEFLRGEPLRTLVIGMALGLPLAAAVYVASLARTAGSPAHLIFVLLVLAQTLGALFISGIGRELMPAVSPWTLRAIGYVGNHWLAGLAALHAYFFLDVPRHLPSAAWPLRLTALFFLVAAPLTLLSSWLVPALLATYGAAFVAAGLLVITALCVARGVPYAKLYWWCWVVYGITVGFYVLSAFALVRAPQLGDWIFLQAPLLCLLLGFTISRQINDQVGTATVRASQAEAARLTQQREYQTRYQLFAATSHDMSHPLQALSMDLQALHAGRRSRIDDERFDRIETSLQEIQSYLDALITAIRTDSPQLEPQISDFEIAGLLHRLVMRYRPLAARKGLAIRWVPSRAIVRSDPTMLSRIVENLLVNAIRYTDQGSILVGCRYERRGGYERICVIDTGPGIAPKLATDWSGNAEYEPAPYTTEQEGYGLGLFIVKRLADALEHPIGVQSVPGKGSTLWVCVPREHLAGAAAAPAVVSRR